MMIVPLSRIVAALVLLAFAVAVSASGQQVAEPDTIMTVELEEIVVTGARSGGETLAIPLAVGVVGVRDFMMSRQAGLSDALWGMPGVHAQSRSGATDIRLTIRGFGARGNGNRSNAGTVRGIKILIDGFPETEPDGRTSLDLVDLGLTQRIEVLRSNASSLFGNASGGVVNIQTERAITAPTFEIGALVGDFGLRSATLGAGTVFGSSRFWLSASGSEYDGWRQNSASRRRLINIGLSSDLGDSTRLRLLASGTDNRYFIPGPLTQQEYEDEPSLANPEYLARKERRENVVSRFGASFSKWWKEHSLELLGYYAPKLLTRSERGTYRNFNRFHVGGGLTYSWTPASWALNPRLVLGVDEAFQDGTILFYSLQNGERGDSLRTNKREAANTFGAFAQITVDLAPNLSLIGGVRWDQQAYRSEVYPAGVTSAGILDELVLSHVTPRVGLLYRFSLNHSFYVHYGGGLEAPAFNEVDPPPGLPGVELNPFLKPMSSSTIEIGVKGLSPFGDHNWIRSLSYSLAAYHIAVTNEIVPYDGGAWYFSAGRSRRYGVETGVDVEFRNGFAVKAAVTLLDAQYVEYANDLGDFAGNAVPGITPAVVNGRLRYHSPFGLTAEAGVEYVASYTADDAGTAEVPSFVVVNGGLSYSVSWSGSVAVLQIGVQNLFDEPFAASAYINPSSRTGPSGNPVPVYLEPGLPRNFFGGVSVSLQL